MGSAELERLLYITSFPIAQRPMQEELINNKGYWRREGMIVFSGLETGGEGSVPIVTGQLTIDRVIDARNRTVQATFHEAESTYHGRLSAFFRGNENKRALDAFLHFMEELDQQTLVEVAYQTRNKNGNIQRNLGLVVLREGLRIAKGFVKLEGPNAVLRPITTATITDYNARVATGQISSQLL